jgi:competence protein ComEC
VVGFYDWFIFEYPEIILQEVVREGKVLEVEKNIEKSNFKITLDVGNKFNVLAFSKNGDFHYGDKVKVYGKEEEPENFSDFNYQGYLLGKKIDRVIFNSELEVLEKGRGWISKIKKLREKLIWRIEKLWPFMESAFLKALLLGDKSDLGKNLNQKLNEAGVSHVFVVSGMHVAIVATFFLKIFNGVGIPRKISLVLISFFVFIFVILVGFSASSVRALIMGMLGFLSIILGRSGGKNVVFLAAVLMLAKDPLLLRFSASFQFSFAAVFGIVYLGDWILGNLKKIIRTDFLELKESLTMTIAAWVATFLLSILYFKKISLVFLLTNLIVIPLIFYVFVFGWVGIILGEDFTFLAWYLIKFLEKVIFIFS